MADVKRVLVTPHNSLNATERPKCRLDIDHWPDWDHSYFAEETFWLNKRAEEISRSHPVCKRPSDMQVKQISRAASSNPAPRDSHGFGADHNPDQNRSDEV